MDRGRFRVAGCVCGLVCTVALPVLAQAARPSASPATVAATLQGQTRSSNLPDLISRYLDAIDGRQATTGPAGSIGGLDEVRKELDRISPGVLPALAPERRRRVLAAFALEAARAGAENEPAAAERLVEWACDTVREHKPADEFDARWQLAAVALLEAIDNPGALEAHLAHAEAQFPAEPRFLLARALAEEQWTEPYHVGHGPTGGRSGPERQQHADEALRRFESAASDVRLTDATDRAEAWLHAGHLELDRRQQASALAAFAEVERLTQDPFLTYLSRLFRGMTLESQGNVDQAAAAYASALQLNSGAPLATVVLARLRFLHGARTDAHVLIEALVQKGEPIVDPWWSYWTGDSHVWQARIDALRESLK